jgi:hypothetical protein
MAEAAKLKEGIEKIKTQLKDKLKSVENAKAGRGIKETKKKLKRLQRKLRLRLVQDNKRNEEKAKHEQKLKETREKGEKATTREMAEREMPEKGAAETV